MRRKKVRRHLYHKSSRATRGTSEVDSEFHSKGNFVEIYFHNRFKNLYKLIDYIMMPEVVIGKDPISKFKISNIKFNDSKKS